MSNLKIKIETPSEKVNEAMWVQVFKIDKNDSKSSKIILDSKEALETEVKIGDIIRIESNISRDDAYEFSSLQVNGTKIHTNDCVTVNEDIEIFAKSVYIDYTLYNKFKDVSVTREGEKLSDGEILHYYDVLCLNFNDSIIVNRKLIQNSPFTIEVHGDVVIKRN